MTMEVRRVSQPTTPVSIPYFDFDAPCPEHDDPRYWVWHGTLLLGEKGA